ncbi:unnamed protein product [Trichobilharzia szidati]|nr:unnamed protein product [Trichobilharzia szidati]
MKSAITTHAIDNGLKIDFENIEILGKSFHSHRERLVSEALHILTTSNATNIREGIDFSSIWQTLMTQNRREKIKMYSSVDSQAFGRLQDFHHGLTYVTEPLENQ